MTRTTAIALLAMAACNQVIDLPEPTIGKCEPDAEFVQLGPVLGLDSEQNEGTAWLAPDELTIVISRPTFGAAFASGVPRYHDLYVAHRDLATDAFGPVTPLAVLSSELDEFAASMTSDLRTVYFDRQENGRYQILRAHRSSPDQEFDAPTPLALGSGVGSDFEPFIRGDTLYFASTRGDGVSSLFAADGEDGSFAEPRALITLETLPFPTAYEVPVVSQDQLTIYFTAAPERTSRALDVWRARRADPSQPFGAPSAVLSVNTSASELPSAISDDDCRLYFITDRGGRRSELWMASRRAP